MLVTTPDLPPFIYVLHWVHYIWLRRLYKFNYSILSMKSSIMFLIAKVFQAVHLYKEDQSVETLTAIFAALCTFAGVLYLWVWNRPRDYERDRQPIREIILMLGFCALIATISWEYYPWCLFFGGAVEVIAIIPQLCMTAPLPDNNKLISFNIFILMAYKFMDTLVKYSLGEQSILINFGIIQVMIYLDYFIEVTYKIRESANRIIFFHDYLVLLREHCEEGAEEYMKNINEASLQFD